MLPISVPTLTQYGGRGLIFGGLAILNSGQEFPSCDLGRLVHTEFIIKTWLTFDLSFLCVPDS